MMQKGAVRLAGAVLAGLASVAAAGGSIAMQVEDAGLTSGRNAQQTAPLPDIMLRMLPPGTPMPAPQPALSAVERREIGEGLLRTPLDLKLFNLLFADAVRTGRPDSEIERLAAITRQLGWRYTPAQQNLMLRALLDERFDDVLDHVDALLRRQKQAALAYTMLSAMEGVPQVHGAVLDKLLARPDWRAAYLAVIGPQSLPALLDARVRTLDALLATPSGLTLDELGPSLAALTASGRGRAAHRLWMRHTQEQRTAGGPGGDNAQAGGNLLYDPAFEQLARRAGGDDLGIPFEWRLGQDLGYAAQSSSEGVMINWDRRGVPVFLSQTVPVRPGRSYTLTLQGTTDQDRLGRLLAPVLLCGTQMVRFVPVGVQAQGPARYRSESLPDACDMGVLAINGAVDTGSGPVNIALSHVALQPAR